MTLKERIKKLADEQNLSLPALESKLGFGNSTIVKWDKSTPNADKLNKVAQYFGVSMDYLLTGKETSTSISTSQSDDGLTDRDKKDIAKDVNNIMEKLTSGEDGPASYNGDPLSPESAELFREELELALKRLKIINKEKYNPYKNKK